MTDTFPTGIHVLFGQALSPGACHGLIEQHRRSDATYAANSTPVEPSWTDFHDSVAQRALSPRPLTLTDAPVPFQSSAHHSHRCRPTGARARVSRRSCPSSRKLPRESGPGNALHLHTEHISVRGSSDACVCYCRMETACDVESESSLSDLFKNPSLPRSSRPRFTFSGCFER